MVRLLLPVCLAPLAGAAGIGDPASPVDTSTNRLATLESLSLEDLLHSDVTTVTRQPEDMFDAAAAVFVITGDDIRRSGAQNIPEALRLAPGVEVAQINGNQWAVSVRGFNNVYANDLLVLMDGRSIYTPNFSGVDWRDVDCPVENIDRIEVVRGPGGTLWGANAVNGVINIITKSSQDTTGGVVSGGGGTQTPGSGTVSYGDKLGPNGFFRVYGDAKHVDHNYGGQDGYDFLQTGFRSDWNWAASKFTAQGDFYYGSFEQLDVIPQYASVPGVVPVTHLATLDDRFHDTGGNLTLHFEHEFANDSDLQVQAYFDRKATTDLSMSGWRNTFDVDSQYHLALPGRQNVMFGLGYRYLPDHFNNPDPTWINWDPASRNWQLFSTFVQDEITLVPDRLRLILGTKEEHNDATGWETEPTARLLWLISPRQTAWAAVSRAVQVPGRNLDAINPIQLPVEPVSEPTGPPFGTLPLYFQGAGNQHIPATGLVSYELGYRLQAVKNLSFDVAAYYNVYDNLVTGQLSQPEFVPLPIPHLEVTSEAVAGGHGRIYGGEFTAQWLPLPWWRLQGNYSLLQEDLPGAQSLVQEGEDPQQQISLRSSLDLPCHWQFDLWGRWVDALPSFSTQGVNAYFDLDARLGWKPGKHLELSLVGQNLIAAHRYEFGQNQFTETLTSAVSRAMYFEVSYRF